MTTIKTATVTLPMSADALYGFLADLSKHRAFLEPGAQGFSGDANSHTYVIEVMGMRLRQEFVAKTRVPGQLVSLVPGAKKLFDHELRYEIAANGDGCTLCVVDNADIPTMMAVMGAEKLLQGQLDGAVARIQQLAAEGKLV
jgi:hypothetical protein